MYDRFCVASGLHKAFVLLYAHLNFEAGLVVGAGVVYLGLGFV